MKNLREELNKSKYNLTTKEVDQILALIESHTKDTLLDALPKEYRDSFPEISIDGCGGCGSCGQEIGWNACLKDIKDSLEGI